VTIDARNFELSW